MPLRDARSTATRPRILLVEDDAPIRLFVAMALEHHRAELVECPTLLRARSELASGPAALVLLDLMLPDGSGLDLLRDAGARSKGGRTSWVVFSAALTAPAQDELALLGVHRVLQKPVSLQTLQSCVEDALQWWSREPADAGDRLGGVGVAPDEQALALIDGTPQAEEAAIRDYFEGRHELFAQIKALAAGRLAGEIAAGDAALARGDGDALLHVAHGLKSMLRMLGRPAAGELARSLEVAAQTGRRDAWATLWQALRAALARAPLA